MWPIAASRAGSGSSPAGRLYGRSRGKALREGQERLLAEALPLFSIAPEALPAGRVFVTPPREMWLEIGFGAGNISLSRRRPTQMSGSSVASRF